jgi:hypothetical protein
MEELSLLQQSPWIPFDIKDVCIYVKFSITEDFMVVAVTNLIHVWIQKTEVTKMEYKNSVQKN